MKIYTIDAFTNQQFSGNPAAVCLLDERIEDAMMLKIAREINFSETAFVLLNEHVPVNLRWFSPTQEVDLCGHATLSAAKILYDLGKFEKDQVIRFDTRSGILTTKMVLDKIEMDFPAIPVIAVDTDEIIASFIGGVPVFTAASGPWCLIVVKNESEVRQLKPNFELLKTHSQKIFIITARSENTDYDFVSRCFGPAVGINEDPVTGSAHCLLAPYWAIQLGKTKLKALQVSERLGEVECELFGNDRVLLRGQAIIMSEILPHWS